MMDENGKSKCFGFVCFSTEEEASRAMTEMNNTNVNGQLIYVALAQPKALRQAQIERERLSKLTMGMGSMNLNMGMGMGNPYSMGPPGMMTPQQWTQQMGNGLPSMRGMSRGGRGTNGNNNGRNGQRGFRSGLPGRVGSPGGRGGRWPSGRSMGPFGRGRGAAFDPAIDGMGQGNQGALMASPAAALASAPPEQQKIMLGEQLYPLVHRFNGDKAAKITGMLLEMDNSEVLYLIENPEALQAKVDEAVNVLKEHDIN